MRLQLGGNLEQRGDDFALPLRIPSVLQELVLRLSSARRLIRPSLEIIPFKQNTSSFKGRHFKPTLILSCARWYGRYQPSYRDGRVHWPPHNGIHQAGSSRLKVFLATQSSAYSFYSFQMAPSPASHNRLLSAGRSLSNISPALAFKADHS